jgi:hypothetical protein
VSIGLRKGEDICVRGDEGTTGRLYIGLLRGEAALPDIVAVRGDNGIGFKFSIDKFFVLSIVGDDDIVFFLGD